MYLDYYGLREAPFAITPDPRFVFLSERHRDALAHLRYGIGQGGGSGFVQLTGEVGTGKTTLSRLLLEQVPATTRVALVLNPLLSPVELLETLGEELRLDLDGRHGNHKALVDALNAHLLQAHAQGLRVVLLVDEAQNLSAATLEQIRLLTNLETPTQKLLQIVLLGQPELRQMLAQPQLRQLAQRITARYHLQPLDAGESAAYLRHRWAVAGGSDAAFPFTATVVQRLHRHAGGVPRLLNVIAERALLAGYARNRRRIDAPLLDLAAREVLPAPVHARRWSLPLRAGTAVGGVIALAVAAGILGHRAPPAAPGKATLAHVPPSRHDAPHRTPAPAPSTTTTPPPAAEPAPAARPIDASTLDRQIATGAVRIANAWHDLLALWSLHEAIAGDEAACPRLPEADMICASGSQPLSVLAQFDRPLVLRFRGATHDDGALLLGLGPTQALMRIAGHEVLLSRAMLEPRIDRYIALGRLPPGCSLPIRIGDHGAGVLWLRGVLRAPPSTGDAGFDDALVRRVRARQRDLGLHADGVVGPETALALLAGAVDGPHLRRLPE